MKLTMRITSLATSMIVKSVDAKQRCKQIEIYGLNQCTNFFFLNIYLRCKNFHFSMAIRLLER